MLKLQVSADSLQMEADSPQTQFLPKSAFAKISTSVRDKLIHNDVDNVVIILCGLK